jgi:hypothetical protein
MKKTFFLCFFLLSLFLLTSCDQDKKVILGSTDPELMEGFVGGNQGLLISVADGTPPSVIEDKSRTPFSVVVGFENKGEADVGENTRNPLVFARLAGIAPNNFGLNSAETIERLYSYLLPAKKNLDGSISRGAMDYVAFENLVYKPAVPDSLGLNMRVEACYDYETYANVKFCMKKDLLESVEDNSICTLRGPLGVGNSGAPLQITSAEQIPVNEDTVQVRLTIEHVNEGVFFKRVPVSDLEDLCIFDSMNPEMYVLEAIVDPLENNKYDVSCQRLKEKTAYGGASGFVKLSSGAPTTLRCNVKRAYFTDQRIYEDMLSITLRYRYGEFLEVPILVQNMG